MWSKARIRWHRSRRARPTTCGEPTASRNVADVMVNSFYDPELEQGCAFEELISFHGGLGGPQTRPFILHPVELPMSPERPVGAAAVHDLLMGWRRSLQAEARQE